MKIKLTIVSQTTAKLKQAKIMEAMSGYVSVLIRVNKPNTAITYVDSFEMYPISLVHKLLEKIRSTCITKSYI